MNKTTKLYKLEVRFWKYIGPMDANGCWPWVGSVNNGGYGQFQFNGKYGMAHKYSYLLYKGDIVAPLTVDHLCRNRRCVNPSHMEIVTNKENILRGFSPSALNSRKTQCLRGHKYSSANTYLDKLGHRFCRKCKRERDKTYYYSELGSQRNIRRKSRVTEGY